MPQHSCSDGTDIEQLAEDEDGLQSFHQRFSAALERLQAELGLEELGRLYDLEIVSLDEANRVRLICYTAFSTTLELPAVLRGRYMWRRLDSFEVENYFIYSPRRYAQFLKSVRQLSADVAVLSKLYATLRNLRMLI